MRLFLFSLFFLPCICFVFPAGLCGRVEASGELILPIRGPIIRAERSTAEHPLCAAPHLFANEGALVPAGTFEYLIAALKDGAIETDSWTSERAAPLTDESLLRSSIHLARVRKLADGLATREGWRVVSLRADFCEAGWRGRPGAAKVCRDEFRLVAQPFELTGMFVRAHDFAFHLIYVLDDRDHFIRTRQKVDEAAYKLIGRASAQQLLDSDRHSCALRIHEDIRRVIAVFARPERLQSISWMTSSASGQQWTFGRFGAMGDGTLVPEKVTEKGFFDNFSKPMLLAEKCPINLDATEAEKEAFKCGGSKSPGAGAAPLLQRFDDAFDLRRPDRLCVSCHSAPALAAILRTQRINDDLGLAIFQPNDVDLSNLRQFGYDLHGYRSVSKRLRRIQGN